MKECTTHHICDCKNEELESVKAELQRSRELVDKLDHVIRMLSIDIKVYGEWSVSNRCIEKSIGLADQALALVKARRDGAV